MNILNEINIAIAQIQVIPGRPDLNFKTMQEQVSKAKAQGVQLLLFPEMCLSGYLIGDTWEEQSFIQDCLEYGKDVASLSQDICIIFGNVAQLDSHGEDGRPLKFNGFYIAQKGNFLENQVLKTNFHPKTLLPNYREFEETRHFFDLRRYAQKINQPLENCLQPFTINIAGKEFKIGPTICEDGWGKDYDINIMESLCQHQCDLIVNISSSPFTLGKNNRRNQVFSNQAKKNSAPIIYVNNTGIQNNGKTIFSFDGSSTVYDAQGEIVFEAPCFENSLYVLNEQNHSEKPTSPQKEIAEIYTTLQYSISQYMQQSGIERVIIGVSGGIDSAVAAALYTRIVGPENVLLVNMPSKFNSLTTISLAEKLSNNLGCYYTTISIEDSVYLTQRQINNLRIKSPEDSRLLRLSHFHMENVQARDRSSRILAALSSAFGGVFTCNANKVETLVGYSTLYGDHGGFLACLADLWKEQVYELGKYMNKYVFEKNVIPQGIFDIVPSAELSDKQDVDKGLGDPLIYWYHDRLFFSWIQFWNRVSPEEILTWYSEGVLEEKLQLPQQINTIFSNAKDFIYDLERWWKLFKGMGIAKRVQAPPIVAVTRRAFGFDFRESLMQPYFSKRYLKLKEKLLS